MPHDTWHEHRFVYQNRLFQKQAIVFCEARVAQCPLIPDNPGLPCPVRTDRIANTK